MYIGGLRARLIHDNIYFVVRDGLEELGWLDSGRHHKPVDIRSGQVSIDEVVEPNIVCVTVEDVTEEEAEMGSMLAENIWSYYVDVYGESESLSLELATDIKDILQGRFTTTVSRGGPNVEIYDLTQDSATPIVVCNVDIEGLDVNKSRYFEKPYQRHWRVVSFVVSDTYNTEDD